MSRANINGFFFGNWCTHTYVFNIDWNMRKISLSLRYCLHCCSFGSFFFVQVDCIGYLLRSVDLNFEYVLTVVACNRFAVCGVEQIDEDSFNI